MALSQAFLDELRARSPLSALIGQSVKLIKAGREYKGCCPFHNEKTASFTVNDDKQFYHCFGCGAHGDAIRWLTDYEVLPFMDAVRQLADAAGMDVPARSPEAAQKAARIDGLRPALEAAQGLYRPSLNEYENVGALNYLIKRGVDHDAIAKFELGYAPNPRGHLKPLGLSLRAALDSGLAWRSEDGGQTGERFRGRIMVPVHDARGKIVGFGGRIFSELHAGPAKYKNSPDSEIFDKGRTLYNLHRAAPLARAQGGKPGRLVVVEGYMDVIAMDVHGIGETVAPMGTALTVHQLERLWRVHVAPILLFDGDSAGRKAAVRACETALPMVGPGGTLHVGILPEGQDPDDLLQARGRDAVEIVLDGALALSDFLFDSVLLEIVSPAPPEAVAAIWSRLEGLAATIVHDETRTQYLAMWRARFDREISAVHSIAKEQALDVHIKADAKRGEREYIWPEAENESERKLIMIVDRMLDLRQQRAEISQTITDLRSMAKTIGFDGKTLTACCVAIEADPSTREESEMLLALYRKVLGIKGPMDEALLQPLAGVAAGAVIEGRSSVKQAGAIGASSASNALAWADVE